jgi:hypothetical protein
MVVSPIPTRAPTLEVVSPIILNLKGEEMQTHVTTLDGSDSDAAACPTITNSLKQTNLTTNTGKNSPKTSTRPTTTNAAEMSSRPGMRAETSACPTTTNAAEMPSCPVMGTETLACPTTTNTAEMPSRLVMGTETSACPTTTNAVEMPSRPGMGAETSACPMLPPTRSPSAWSYRLPRPSHRRVPRVYPALL